MRQGAICTAGQAPAGGRAACTKAASISVALCSAGAGCPFMQFLRLCAIAIFEVNSQYKVASRLELTLARKPRSPATRQLRAGALALIAELST